MINWIFFLLLAIWLVSHFRQSLLYNYLWQLKEYRFDRMSEFLGSNKGKKMICSPYNIFRVLLLGHVILVMISPNLVGLYSGQFLGNLAEHFVENEAILNWIMISIVVASNAAIAVFALIHHRFYRPVRTFRMILMLVVNIVAEAFLMLKYGSPQVLILLELLRPVTVTLVMMLVGIPFYPVKKYLILKATKKRRMLQELKVIGITGSYGKSSTKEFLASILEHRFKVAKTPEHVNVDIGIAQTVLKTLTSEHEIFVVEMGAYKRGEIESSCNIVKPEIGIITGVNEQHLCFFKTIENTIKAKAELLASLPKYGLAIVNGDNENAVKTLDYNNADHVIRYRLADAEYMVSTIRQTGHILTFHIEHAKEKVAFEVPVFGKHYIENLLACIHCSLHLGLSLQEIAEYAKAIEAPDHSLQIFEGRDQLTIIDDSYNSNPDGFIAALDALKSIKAKHNILVTPGMMELGEKSKELHRRLAPHIAAVCSTVIITSEDSYKILRDGINEIGDSTEVIFEDDYDRLSQIIKSKLHDGDAILFENRVPQALINSLKKK